MPWELTGNNGTNPATDFLGTTDGQPLVIKTNATEALRIDPNRNVGIGMTTPGAKLDVTGSGLPQCCAPVLPTVSLSEDSAGTNRQAWLQFHNGGEAEAFIRLAGAGSAGSGREGQRRLEIGDNQGVGTDLIVTGNI